MLMFSDISQCCGTIGEVGTLSGIDLTAFLAFLRRVYSAPTLTLLAVVAALAVPYIADHLNKKRRGRAALQLSELALKAIDPIGGVETGRQEESLELTARELNLTLILEAMSRMPPDHLATAQALDAFIRLQGVGRSLIAMEKRINLSTEDAVVFLTARPKLRAAAGEHVQRLRDILG